MLTTSLARFGNWLWDQMDYFKTANSAAAYPHHHESLN